MPDAIYADPSERLPWLPNSKAEPVHKKPAATRNFQPMAGWAFAAMLIVAGASYWLGRESAQQAPSGRVDAPAQATVKMPEAPSTGQPQVRITETPEVRPAPAPTIAVPEPTSVPVRSSSRRLQREEASTVQPDETAAAQPVRSRTSAAPATPRASVTARPQPLTLWPSRQTKGANGRLVQIGAFGSRDQAKLGWRRMQRAYPAIGRLPAVVVDAHNSKGRKFYRFQIGTTSHAHSEVLCQRMAKIRYSCAVIGLPWKAKIER